MSSSNAKEIRKNANVSQIRVAVAAGVAEPTVRLYEANPSALSDERKRARLDRVYANIAKGKPLDEGVHAA